MSWSTGPVPQEKPLSPTTQSALGHYGNEAAVVQAWQEAAKQLEAAKLLEAKLRLVVFELKFPHPTEGTNRAELGNGWNIKATYPFTYKLDNKESKTEVALDKMAEISQQAGFIADRLVKWDPELSTKEYRLLNPDNPAAQTAEQKAILALLLPILTIKPGMPQLEIEAPKAGK